MANLAPHNRHAGKFSTFAAAALLSVSTILTPLAGAAVANDIAAAEANNAFAKWAEHDNSSHVTVDHSPFTNLLNAVSVKDRGRDAIAYTAIQGQNLSFVKSYIRYLERIEVSKLNKNEQLAYWLNLHNAGVIHVLAKDKNAYRRVKKLRGTPEKPGTEWTKTYFRIEGQNLSLQDIEQNILAQHWDDPSFIYGLCYGVQGSPSIGKVAFSGKNVHKLLKKNAEDFVNSTRNVKVSKKGAQVSSLYEWNKAALFDGDDAAVLAHISTFAKPKLAKKIASVSSINKHRFSWKTNAFVPRTQSAGSFGGGGGGGGGGYGGGGGGS